VGLGHLASDFCVALNRCDITRLKYVAGRFVVLVGKAMALSYGGVVEEGGNGKSPFLLFFLWIYWLTACHVAARFDRESQIARVG
jgi:hypothetical protein